MSSDKNIYYINLLSAFNVRGFLINLSLILSFFRLCDFLSLEDLNKNIKRLSSIFVALSIAEEDKLDLYESAMIFVIASVILIGKKRVERKILENIEVLLTLESYLVKRVLGIIARIIIRIEVRS